MKVSRNLWQLIPVIVILMMIFGGSSQQVFAQDKTEVVQAQNHCLVESEVLRSAPGIIFDLRTPADLSVKIDKKLLPAGDYGVAADWCDNSGNLIARTTTPVPEGQVVVVKLSRPNRPFGSVFVRVLRGLDLRSGASDQATWAFLPELAVP